MPYSWNISQSKRVKQARVKRAQANGVQHSDSELHPHKPEPQLRANSKIC